MLFRGWRVAFLAAVLLVSTVNLFYILGGPRPHMLSVDKEKLPGLSGRAHALVAHGGHGTLLPKQDATEQRCYPERHAEYGGPVVGKWGSDSRVETAAECCAVCKRIAACNVWVFCGDPAGCRKDDLKSHGFGECWTKTQEWPDEPVGSKGPGVRWTSGALFSDLDAAGMREKREAKNKGELARLSALKSNESLPLVYFDIELKGERLGRILFVLFTDTSPRAAENFRLLTTGEKGLVPGDGKPGREGVGTPYHFKGHHFYRIIDKFICQTGAGTDSIFGGPFKDDPGGLRLKHDRPGLLSMANNGLDTGTSHFSITMAPAPHLNGAYEIFGEVVEGFGIAEKINTMAQGMPDNTALPEDAKRAIIADCGQIRRGTIVPKLA